MAHSRHKRKRRVRLASARLNPSVGNALDRFLQILGDAEGDLLRRLDLDGSARRRVTAHTRRTVAHLKDAEARDTDLVALLEMLHDETDEIVEAAGRVLLRHAGLLSQLGRDLRERNGRYGRLLCRYYWCCHSEGSLTFFRFAGFF